MTTDTPGTDASDPAAVSSAVPFTNTREPSAKEREVLAIIREGIRRDGKAPTVRAIVDMTGAGSTSTIQRRISSLIDLGLLRRANGTLEVVEGTVKTAVQQGPQAFRIEVPNLSNNAPEKRDDTVIAVPTQLLSHGEHAVVIAHDDGMSPDIRSGDLVVVRRISISELPDDPPETYLVAATVGGATVVRTLSKVSGRPWLLASNPTHSPINLDDASLLGQAVSLMRRL
ncbi:LexA family transcriptional regulator [Cutibacterium sp. WCA-380-WT-3A]|uniref:LexA family transcriptional regulator n=1 Tax=Cutibacterium porci TaxID=2605781 RepID=A0A7K0J7D8_9ACTN|nr:S24 family peptidase [Cutibacterium porci]MSS45628.1 LexA family transcriptional regulator [Cutibacterium porci]